MQQIKSNDKFSFKDLDLRDRQDHHSNYAFKWGLARIILDSLSSNQKKIIELLPFYHVGMDKVLPNTKPYIPQRNKHVTIFIRSNGSLKITNEFIKELCKGLSSTTDKRMRIMNFLEDEVKKVKLEALKKHLLINE